MIHRTHDMSFDICQSRDMVDKVRNDDAYAQNLYAALCNNEFREDDVWQALKGKTWSCSWRAAGGIISDIRGQGGYTDWYCSGMGVWVEGDGEGPSAAEKLYVPEGMITQEVLHDLAQIGWHPIDQK